MTLARPGHASRLFALQASANREATAGYRRVLAELAKVQEAAEYAQRLAARKIEVSAAVIMAEREARASKGALKVAAAAAARAADLYHAHSAARPTGWRGLIARATGVMARHDARNEELRKAKLEIEHAEKERDCESHAADRHVEQAIEAYKRDAANIRNARRQDAESATLRAEDATRAVALLNQNPAFAGMGVEALMQLGRRLLSQEKASASDPTMLPRPASGLAPQ